jgi:hypothetical protein
MLLVVALNECLEFVSIEHENCSSVGYEEFRTILKFFFSFRDLDISGCVRFEILTAVEYAYSLSVL